MFNKLLVDTVLVPFFRIWDTIIPKKESYWAFAVHHIKSNLFIENARAVFERVKSDEKIKKIIFIRKEDSKFDIDGAKNVHIVKLKSISGLVYFSRCKIIFVAHSISMDYSLRWKNSLFSVLKINLRKHIVINLWHGKPIKKLYALANPLVKKRLDRVKYRKKERKYYRGLITSSQIDSYAMSTMFHPIKYENVWVSGYPQNDFLINKLNDLPNYIQKQINYINQIKKGRKLITYAPTYRQTDVVKDSEYYQFSIDEISELKKILIKHNAILGFRFHYFRNSTKYFNLEDYIDNEYIFDLGHHNIAEITPIIRESDLIISDYSSVFIDSLYINKPVLGFTYDLKHFRENQDGLLYDLDIVFPGPIFENFKPLLLAIDSELTSNQQIKTDRYRIAQKFFFEHIDNQNAQRVINMAKNCLNKSSE